MAVAFVLAGGACEFTAEIEEGGEPRFVRVPDERVPLTADVANAVMDYLTYQTDAYPESMAPLSEGDIVSAPDVIPYALANGECKARGSCFPAGGFEGQQCQCRGCNDIYALCGECENFQCDK